jgi:rod shape-determining protein MreC
VYDKTVRRRRAVLGLLVAGSLALLTAYFGESAGGGLHAVQRGVLEVVSPIQEGASRALKPIRDLFGWVGDTLDAKGEVERLDRQLKQERAQAIAYRAAARENEQLRKLLELDQNVQLSRQGPVSARVIGQSPTVWYGTIGIDKGSSSGVAVNQPVVTGDGLVGKVTTVSPHAAIVTLITDHSVAVSARINETTVKGVVQTAVGNPRDLVLEFTQGEDAVRRGQTVVTAGTTSQTARLSSLFPPGIPIGRVSRIDEAGSDSQEVHVRAFADLRRLEFVQVITKPATRPAA